MAINDCKFFNDFAEDQGKKIHDLDADNILVALVDSTLTPVADAADPRWGNGGSTDYSANEVTAGGNYTAGGININATWSRSGNVVTLNGDDLQWLQDAGNPTNARWGIIYNNTDTGKAAIGWIDLGSAYNMTGGDLNINFNVSGVGTFTVTP